MSEVMLPKLNLKALKPLDIPEKIPLLETKDTSLQSTGENLQTLVSPSEEIGKEKVIGIEEIKKNPKIALGTIKKSVDAPLVEKISLEEVVPQKVEISEPAPKSSVEGLSLVDMGDKAPSKEILEFIKMEAQEDTKNQEIKTEETSNPVVFQNYESGFKKQSGNVLKRIQNFRYTPKTRAGLLIGLIVISFSGIALLMIFFPEKHSLSLYKAGILETFQNTPEIEDIPDITIPDVPIPDESIIPDEIVPEEIISEETVPDESIIPDTEIIEEVSSEEVSQNTKEQSIKKQEQKEKLRQFILKKYTS